MNTRTGKIVCVFIIIGIFNEIKTENLYGVNTRVKRIVGGKAAAKPPPDDPVVFARMYNRDARVEGSRSKTTGIYTFLGLRFADPPIGPNRFTRPRYRRMEGDINATKHGPPCPQPHPDNPNIVVGNEDCLMLNIYTPQMPDETTGLPVYVWIHPGGFRYGSAAQYDAEPIAQQGIIFVPVQYRLGTLGIIGDGRKDFNGNLALFDMAAALRWVTDYISFFGGDPKQIKVIGHGTGAASAMFLSMSKLPRSGSISGVVAMSGSALAQYANDEKPIQSLQEIAQINDCPTVNETEIVNCLRLKSVRNIIMKDSQVQAERIQGRAMVKAIAGCVGFNPHVEEADDMRALPGLITDQPVNSIVKKNFSNIPLLIGVTKQETGNSISLNTINDVFGSAETFLNSLVDGLHNLQSLLRIDKLTGVITKPVLPGIQGVSLELNDLLKVPNSLSPLNILSKITEVTTDALFNLPATLSAQAWAKTSSAFFYSFEYKGSTSKGINFLRGLPLVSVNNNVFVAHGDELGYLFNANDIEGNPLPQTRLNKPEDLRVRQNFISVLKTFGNSITPTRDENSLFQSISSDNEGLPYIKIDSNLKLLSDFRFCELLLWGAPLRPLQSSSCQGLANALSPATNILRTVTTGLTDSIGLNLNRNQSSNSLNIENLFG